jgi:glycosyltransferase involved in cell wall biosynthesis
LEFASIANHHFWHSSASNIHHFFPSLRYELPVKAVLISISIPNDTKMYYLARVVRSALRQSLSNLGILISDDCLIDLTKRNSPSTSGHRSMSSILGESSAAIFKWNRAKCACSARGSWVIFVDSDDELMNRTADIDFKTHKITGIGVIEHKMQQGFSSHRIYIFTWREAHFQGVDNNTLTIAMRKGIINWTLPRKMIERFLYQQALAFLGIEICRLRIIFGEDKLQATTLYRFVPRFATVNYFGYLYHRMSEIIHTPGRRNSHWRNLLSTNSSSPSTFNEHPILSIARLSSPFALGWIRNFIITHAMEINATQLSHDSALRTIG